jgi:hypothetical protein
MNIKIYYNIFLIGLSLLIATIFSVNILPHEDAAILFRYSENLSNTGIISYNPNGVPTEGATDFLWMVIIAILHKFGVDSYFSAITLNLFSLIIISNIITNHYKLNISHNISIFFLHFCFSFFWSSIFGFSVLFVELFLILFLFAVLENNLKKIVFYSFLGSLIRPDFILLIFFINVFYFFTSKIEEKKKFIPYIIIGLLYFVSRFIYFGELLPLPFYVKTQWIFFENLGWLKQIIILSPIILSLIIINKNLLKKKEIILIFISVILIPTLFYMNQPLYQNYGQRFYFYIPVVFLILFYFSYNLRKPLTNFYILIFTCLISLFVNFKLEKDLMPFNLIYQNENPVFIKKKSNIYKFANIIKKFENLNIASTESGLFPYYSKANTVDLFGLNTRNFAKKPAGGLYIKDNDFDIIIINSSQYGTMCKGLKFKFLKAKQLPSTKYQNRKVNWDNFTLQIVSGIEDEKYIKYIYPFYSKKINENKNTFIFLNKYSPNFKELEKFILLDGKICK